MPSDCSPDNCLLLGSLCSPIDKLMARSSASEGIQSRFSESMINRIATEEHARKSYYSSCNRPVRAPAKSLSDNEMCYGVVDSETCEFKPRRCLYSVREVCDLISAGNSTRQDCPEKPVCMPSCFIDDEMYERETDLPISQEFVSPAEFKKYHPPKCREDAPAVQPSAMYDHDGRRQYYRDKGNTHWMIVPPGPRFRTCYPQVYDSTDLDAGSSRHDENRVRDAKKQWRGEKDRFMLSPRCRYQNFCNIINDTCCTVPKDICGNPVVDICCQSKAKTPCCTPVSRFGKKPPRKICSSSENCTEDAPLRLPIVNKSQAADDCTSRPKVLVLTEQSDDNKCGYPKTLILWETANPEGNINFSSNLYTVISEFDLKDFDASTLPRSISVRHAEGSIKRPNCNSDSHAEAKIRDTNEVSYQEPTLKELLGQLSILEKDHEEMDEFLFKMFSRGFQEPVENNDGPNALPIIKLEGEIIPEFSPPPAVQPADRSNQDVEQQTSKTKADHQSQASDLSETTDISTTPEFSPVNITIRPNQTVQPRPLRTTSCRYPEIVFVRRRRRSKAGQLKSRSSCRTYSDRQKEYETNSSSSSSDIDIATKARVHPSDPPCIFDCSVTFEHSDDPVNHLIVDREKRHGSKHRRGFNSSRECKTSGSESESRSTGDVVFTEWYNSHLKSVKPVWQTLNIEMIGSPKTLPDVLNKPAILSQHDNGNTTSATTSHGSIDLKDLMNRNWNANDVNPSSSNELSRTSDGEVDDFQRARNTSQNSHNGESSDEDENDTEDARKTGFRFSFGSSIPDFDHQDHDSDTDTEIPKERMTLGGEFGGTRENRDSQSSSRQPSSIYNSPVPEKKKAETSVHKPSVRISVPHDTAIFTTQDTKVEPNPKTPGSPLNSAIVSDSGVKSSISSMEGNPASSTESQSKRTSALIDMPSIPLSSRSSERQSSGSADSIIKSRNSIGTTKTDSKDQFGYQDQEQDVGKLISEKALREFASILVKQLYAAIKEKTDRNLNEDKAIPEQRMMFIKEKIDEEIQVCLLPLLVDHIIWLIRQDIDTEDEKWFEKVDVEMIEDYIDLVVTNTTLVAHEQVEGRQHAKSFVAASNCHCHLVDMLEKFNKQKLGNGAP